MRRHVLAVLAILAGAAGLLSSATAQAQNRFWLVNNTGRVIESAFVSASRVDDWGPDILGSNVLPSGNRVWVTPNFGDCVLDIRVTYQGGGEERRMQVNACSLSTIAFGRSAGAGASVGGGGGGGGAGAAISPGRPAAANPSFYLRNGSGVTIREVYVSLSSDRNWGGDRLGQNVLQPGQRLQVSLPAGVGCTVDIRVVYMDGRAGERRGMETCRVSEVIWR
ncbi:Tat pathway signal protein [Roseomonas sp. AR75]|uniref:Tat pathway signal protein n=1 Tax=Roseomonas sp. AR75 TaxID=2562311 RepID=UPI0010C0D699|nr:Tat pathway signal protein [Roseomonas sp. AR75]